MAAKGRGWDCGDTVSVFIITSLTENNETPRMKIKMVMIGDKGAGSGMAAPGIPRIRIIILMPGYVSVRPFLSAFNLEKESEEKKTRVCVCVVVVVVCTVLDENPIHWLARAWVAFAMASEALEITSVW